MIPLSWSSGTGLIWHIAWILTLSQCGGGGVLTLLCGAGVSRLLDQQALSTLSANRQVFCLDPFLVIFGAFFSFTSVYKSFVQTFFCTCIECLFSGLSKGRRAVLEEGRNFFDTQATAHAPKRTHLFRC